MEAESVEHTLDYTLFFGFTCVSWLSVPPSSAGVCRGSASAAALCDRGVWGAAGPALGADHILHCTGQQGSPS